MAAKKKKKSAAASTGTKKKGGAKKKGAKKARSKHIPLPILKRRLVRLSSIVKSRGG